MFFFFSSRRRHTRCGRDWSSDVCSSDLGMAARCYSARKVSGWVDDREHEMAETTRLARKVAQIGKDDPVALSTAGMALAYVVGDLDDGAAMIERSLTLNPNAAWTWLF